MNELRNELGIGTMKAPKTTVAAMTGMAVLSTLVTLGAGQALAGTTGLANRVAGTPGINGLMVYAARMQALSADGTTSWLAICPAGFLPVGGGAIVQDPRRENVTQAGFHTNPATRKFDGYQASVYVSGLPAGGAAGFIVQVACMPTAARLIYRLRTQVVSARGRPRGAKSCHAGICPAGAMAGRVRIGNVTQAGFHTNPATGKFDGYQASVSLGTPPRGGKLVFAVQVVCLTARTPPVYGPSTPPLPLRRNSSWGVACPAGTIPAAGGAILQNQLTGGKLVLVSGQSR